MGLLNEPGKITKYKLQNTNKSQITMSKITNSPIGLDKRHHSVFFAEGVYLPEGRHPIPPFPQVVSAANLSSKYLNYYSKMVHLKLPL